jgi:hypothetical protein
MQVTYELIQRDFYEAMIAHRDRKALTRWSIRGLIVMALLLIMSAILLLVLKPDLNSLRNLAPFPFLIAFWCLIIWGAPWWSARSQFKNQPGAKGQKALDVDPAGCHFQGNTGRSETEWSHFVMWLESKNLILLYQSPIVFMILPKRAFAPDQLSEFRALLTQKVIQN